MAELWMDFREFYWSHREAFRLAGGGLIFVCAQVLILLWTLRRLGELSNIRERISRLADGLALLTDTTEAGLATLAGQLDQAAPKGGVKNVTRSAVRKRVKEAARKGERVSKIAAHEALSESEVRLHLAMAGRDRVSIRAAYPQPAAVPVDHSPLAS